MKRPALQNKRVGVLRMAFRAGKVFGSFEKRQDTPIWPHVCVSKPRWNTGQRLLNYTLMKYQILELDKMPNLTDGEFILI